MNTAGGFSDEVKNEAGEKTVAVRLSYDGPSFSGYARQMGPDGVDRVHTVQGDLEHALQLVYRRPIATVCAGRTDAGVHARGQVVSFRLSSSEFEERSLERLAFNLNGITVDAMEVTGIQHVADGFSARFDAVNREYRYLIVPGKVPPVSLRGHSWWVPAVLDVAAMQEAAACLVGKHDFRSFCLATSGEGRNTVRDLVSVDITRQENLGEFCLCIRVSGNAFLHNMVRILVGTLVDVGVGRRAWGWAQEVLDACDRTAAGPTAPPEGLVFWEVVYPPGAFEPSSCR